MPGMSKATKSSRQKPTPSKKRSSSNADIWRDVSAALACFVTVVAAAGGLVSFYVGLQLAVLGGIVAGVVAASPARAAAVAALAAGAGTFVGSLVYFSVIGPTSGVQWMHVAIATFGAAAIAFGVRTLVRSVKPAPLALCVLAIALLLGNMWWTALSLDFQRTLDPSTRAINPPLIERLAQQPSYAVSRSDNLLYASVARAVHDGAPFYPSFRTAFEGLYHEAPSSPTNFRFPLLSYVWGALGGPGVLWAYLVLASLGVVAAAYGASQFVKLPLVIPGCALLAAYFLAFGVSVTVFTPEIWASVFALVSFAAYALATRSKRWRAAVGVAVAGAVLAAIVKEVLVYVLIAGLASSFAEKDEEKRFRLIAWGSGLALVVVALGIHYLIARGYVDAHSAYKQLSAGSFGNVVAGVIFSTEYLGQGWLPISAAIASIAGASLIPDRRLRVNLLACMAMPLVAFLLFSNSALSETGAMLNYWGAAVAPLLFACTPLAFQLVPGGARKSA
jgi:hypothetical protein